MAATVLAGAVALGGPLNGALQESYSSLVEDAAAAHVPVRNVDLAGHLLNVYPLTIDGLEITSFIALLALRPTGHLRTWIWVLLLGSFAISLAGNGVEPSWVRTYPLLAFGTKAVPALSGAGSAHLILLMAYRALALLRTLLTGRATQPEPVAPPVPAQGTELAPAQPAPVVELSIQPRLRMPEAPNGAPSNPDAAHPEVLRVVRDGRGYRTLMDLTGWGRPRSENALRAAREGAQLAQPGPRAAQDDDEQERTFRAAPGGTGREGVAA
jgi:hypothetical protein